MKFWLKADIQFEAEDLYAACQRLRLHFAEAAGAIAGGTAIPKPPGSGPFALSGETSEPTRLVPKPEAKKK